MDVREISKSMRNVNLTNQILFSNDQREILPFIS
jgi:hypothetical protein